MKIFDSTTENMKLGGRWRGGNMAVLRVDHPDIVAFIDSKRRGRPKALERQSFGGRYGRIDALYSTRAESGNDLVVSHSCSEWL